MISLLWMLIVVQIVDAITTIKILERGGKELNPAMAWLFEKMGVIEGLFVVKTVICSVFYIWMESIPAWGFLAIIGLTGAVVYHNILQLQK